MIRVGSSPARFVLVALARHADNATGICWPSIPRLADITGLAERTVRRAIGELEKLGLVLVTRRGGKAGNKYTLPWVSDPVTLTALKADRVTPSRPPNAVTEDPNAATECSERGHSDLRNSSVTEELDPAFVAMGLEGISEARLALRGPGAR